MTEQGPQMRRVRRLDFSDMIKATCSTARGLTFSKLNLAEDQSILQTIKAPHFSWQGINAYKQELCHSEGMITEHFPMLLFIWFLFLCLWPCLYSFLFILLSLSSLKHKQIQKTPDKQWNEEYTAVVEHFIFSSILQNYYKSQSIYFVTWKKKTPSAPLSPSCVYDNATIRQGLCRLGA